MSSGQQDADTSFGDPNARPPTPQRTPTTPLLQTPKQNLLSSSSSSNTAHLDDSSSAWTPRFAEEYSVFNSTPGNFRAASSSGGASHLFAPVSPEHASSSTSATGKTKRPLSTDEGIALDSAAHADADADQLTAADPSALAVTPAGASHKDDATSNSTTHAQQPQHRSAKKARTASNSSGGTAKSPFLAHRQTQTATPPPSSRGGRKLAPKPQTTAAIMQQQNQNQGFPQPAFSNAPVSQQQQQQHPQLDTAFMTTDDVFGGYPMAPATAPPIAGPRFWGFDMDASGLAIDVDLAATGTDLFGPVQSQGQLRQLGSMDWGRTDHMFQQSGMVAQPDLRQHSQQQTQPSPQQNNNQKRPQSQPTRRERPLAPKLPNMTTSNMESPSQNFDLAQFNMPVDNNPFSVSPSGVDPGMLLSQPPLSAGMDSGAISMSMSMSMDNMPQPTSSTPAKMEQTKDNVDAKGLAAEKPMTGERERASIRNEGSLTETGQERGKQRKQASRPRAISPTKNTRRSGLSRSFSESARGGKQTTRSLLPALAPLRPVTVHQPDLPHPPPPVMASQASGTRPQTQDGPSSTSGRRSPLKSTHHHRLSSLTSIPENATRWFARSRSAKRTSVKFVIDDNGRARAETVVDGEDEDVDDDGTEIEAEKEMEPTLPVSSSQRSAHRNSWTGPPSVSTPVLVSDDEEYLSSSDDEPIIIPSRNTSFAYPDPPKSSGSGNNSRPPTTSSIFSQHHHHRIHHRSFSDRPPSFHHHGAAHVAPDHHSMDVDPPGQLFPPARPSTGSSLGDAASELRKIMQAGNPRQQQPPPPPPPLPGSSGASSGHRQRFLTPGQRSSSSTISEASLPRTSPTHGREQSRVRCVCNRPEAGGVVFMVKCDSCDSLLHGHCVDMPQPADRPHVYICAFCANTPNMRGGRMRYTGTAAGVSTNVARNRAAAATTTSVEMMGPPVLSSAAAAAAAASSPLAHKSFRTFR